MLLRWYFFLAGILLLTSFTACSKKEEATPAEVKNIASYTHNGQMITCEAKQVIVASTTPGYDYLAVRMTTIPEPSSGAEYLELTFRRPVGQPATTYLPVLNGMVLYNSSYPNGLAFQFNIVNRTFADDESITGTFYSEMRTLVPGGTYTVDHTLTTGAFTRVEP